MKEGSTYDEKDWLLLISQGSEAAFRQLFNAYRKKLFSYVYKITESKEAAEDAVQEIFLTVWNKKENLPQVENINAYLHRMAHNFAYQGFRQLAKETLVKEFLKQEIHQQLEPGQVLLSKEVTVYIQSLVDRLTPQQRKVFLLSREEGLKQEEIAVRLNVSISTVKKHMVDALHFLREDIRLNYGSQAIALYVLFDLTL